MLAGKNEAPVRNWIKAMDLWQLGDAARTNEMKAIIRKELDGYTATADPPASLMIPELMEMYPNAKVLCTVRDRTKWVESMLTMRKLIIPFPVATGLYFWIPSLRYMGRFWGQIPGVFERRYGEGISDMESGYRVYDKHHELLENLVPKEKLFYVDVKDGWGPMCEALGVEVPKDVEFPRLNDSKDMEVLFKKFAQQGIARWGMFFAGVSVVVAAAWMYWRGL